MGKCQKGLTSPKVPKLNNNAVSTVDVAMSGNTWPPHHFGPVGVLADYRNAAAKEAFEVLKSRVEVEHD
jgi:hypothetical protein